MRPTPRLLAGLAFASLCTFSPLLRAHPPEIEMATAAQALLAALPPDQRTQATFPLTDAERENWNFVPTRRAGLPLKEMSAAHRELTWALLRSGLGAAGEERAEGVIALEQVLRELSNNPTYRDPGLYFITVFGVPAADVSWGWRFEGHHVSFNFTLVDGTQVFFTPSFIGSNPAEVRTGARQGFRLLRAEDDQARAFIKSLPDEQRAIAVISAQAPSEIITGNDRRVSPLSPAGIAAGQLAPAQQAQLFALVKLYLDRWRPELAVRQWDELVAAGLDRITFAWAGGLERGEPNYHRIQTPTLLIEFDNTQNQANHIHTTVRSFQGDFGHDLLREHYAQEHAK